MTDPAPLLARIDGLSVDYRVGSSRVTGLRSVSFTVARGEVLAIVGESGSGKSTLVGALTGLLADNARIEDGTVTLAGTNARPDDRRAWAGLRGKVVGLVPQDPGSSLNPTMRIGDQVAEALSQQRGLGLAEREAEALRLLKLVGLDRHALRARQYPHELSGGMRQRVLIAIALAGGPQLIVADEPTSALDATVQKRVLDHLERLVREQGLGMVIVTHDLGVAADRADRILVMKDGRLVESGTPRTLLAAPAHDYTRSLIAAAPALNPQAAHVAAAASMPDSAPALLEFRGIGKAFPLPGTRGLWGRGQPAALQVLDDLSFSVPAGRTTALVGESGSGKTTALRIALGLDRASAGRVLFDGQDVTDLDARGWRPLRSRIQFVQQNPFSALDPRFTVFESIIEPLVAHGQTDAARLQARARQLVDRVHLPQVALNRLPLELSGGQRQRVAIARALALDPELLVLDEPVSALDVSVQAQILDLLGELQRELAMSYLFVSHNLAVVAAVSHQIVVIHKGRTVDRGTPAQVFGAPQSDHTRALIDAIPGRRFAAAS